MAKSTSLNTPPDTLRLRLHVRGTVQGVGFRPFVFQRAVACRLGGWVCNLGDGVRIEVEGHPDAVEQFLAALREAPPLARVSEILREDVPPLGETTFAIRESAVGTEARAVIPPDAATCPDCLAEMQQPTDRRFRYPFINCTHCGPRFTIIESLPYDRPRTTMRNFTMCPACQAEYADPGDRRFHAQPNACPVCGPHLRLDGEAGLDPLLLYRAALRLRTGAVVAVKGIGGYHLACDGRREAAVARLRARKGRADKPFALMCRDLAQVREYCLVDDASARLLCSPARPIVLLTPRPRHNLAPSVAPGVHTLGVMLPYTPLHALLLADVGGPLVMTSGNLSDEPLAFRDDDARERLAGLADHFLTHDRPIHVGCDDSIARAHDGGVVILRRARGYVPLPIDVAEGGPPVFAAGGDLKSTFCLLKDGAALLSQHLGDLEHAATLEHYEAMAAHFRAFFDANPTVVAHDLHPDYHSTRYALALLGVRRVGVQHHHAHIAACLAEHRVDGPVIGVAFDGTGYGPDGTVWGGEFLLANLVDFRRMGRLAPFPLPGGEAAIRRPGRIALAHLLKRGLSATEAGQHLPDMAASEVLLTAAQIDRGVNTPVTSSMGRLFDAVSALLGICPRVGYEGQAAMALEAAAIRQAVDPYPYHLTRAADGLHTVDVGPLFTALLADRADPGLAAARFHVTVAEFTTAMCELIREDTGLAQVALSGGVFQNVLLLRLLRERLASRGFQVYDHHAVPPNDGGLALGQAVVAARRMRDACV